MESKLLIKQMVKLLIAAPLSPRWFWQMCSRQCSPGWLMVWGFLVVSCWVAGSVGRGEGGLLLKKASWGTNLSLFSVSLQWEQQDKAAEMGHRFPGRAGRPPHWSLMPMESLQAANTLPEITTTNTTTKKNPNPTSLQHLHQKKLQSNIGLQGFHSRNLQGGFHLKLHRVVIFW